MFGEEKAAEASCKVKPQNHLPVYSKVGKPLTTSQQAVNTERIVRIQEEHHGKTTV